MQLHTFMIAGNSSRLQFCVFTGSGSPTDEWHHETDSRGDKVVRVEFEISRFASSTEFNDAVKAAEQKATEEYHKHCALRGPMEVDLGGHVFDLEEFGKFSREAIAKMEQPPGRVCDYEANVSAIKDYFDFVRSTEEKLVVTPQGAFINKEGVTVPLNNAEVKVALGQYAPTSAENEAAEDFFKRHGVRPYVKNSAELDKAVSKIVAAFPIAFGIVKQPLTPEQKADMDKHYEILMRQTKDAVGVILGVDNLSQSGLPKGPENATDAKQRLDAVKKSWDANISGKLIPVGQQYGLLNTFLSEAKKAGITHLPIDPHQTAMYAKPENTVNAVGRVRLNTSDPAYTLFSTDTGRVAASAVSYLPIDQQKLPTSDPIALDAIIEKRTKMAEALRKQGVEFIGYEIDNANIEALKQRVRVAKRSYDATLVKPFDGNSIIECERCYSDFSKACDALRVAGILPSDVL